MSLIRKFDFLNSISLELNPDFDMERRVLENGTWEPHVVALMALLIKEGHVCLDIGANIGLHTLSMAKASGQSGKVISFEPGNASFERLNKNVSLNPSLRQQIVCEKLGVSDKKGTLKLFLGGDGSNAYVAEEFNPNLWNKGGAEDFEQVNITTIDEHFRGKNVDFIKVDVEGMEYDVFRGARNTLQRSKPTIIFETLPSDFGATRVQNSEKYLRELGYVLFGFLFRDEYLIPVSYPALHADSLAIHQSKLDSILPHLETVVAPFSIYSMTLPNDPQGTPLFEISVSRGENHYILARLLNQALPTSLMANACPLETGRGVCSKDAKRISDTWDCSLELLDPQGESCRAIIRINQDKIELHGKRIHSFGSPF